MIFLFSPSTKALAAVGLILTPSFGVSLLIAYSVSVSFLFTLTLFLKVEITISPL
jgi:hypothetical protein